MKTAEAILEPYRRQMVSPDCNSNDYESDWAENERLMILAMNEYASQFNQPSLSMGEEVNVLSEKEYFSILGTTDMNACARTVWDTLEYHGWNITRKQPQP